MKIKNPFDKSLMCDSPPTPQDDTILLTNTHKCLDVQNYVNDVDYQDENVRIDWSIWESGGRYYRLTECCKGKYKSGRKKGQICWQDVRPYDHTSEYCSKHMSQQIQ